MNKEYTEIINKLPSINVRIRHDIDGPEDIEPSFRILDVYRELGLTATFYFLPNVSNNWPGFQALLNRVVQEQLVGLHIDAGPFMPSGDGLNEYITKGVKWLHNPLTCSGHGSLESHKYGYSYEIWNHYEAELNAGLNYNGKKYNLRKFGLYKDFSMLDPYHNYLGDSMGRWAYYTPSMGLPIPYEGNLPTTKNPMGLIDKWTKPLQILIHPRYSL